MLKIAIVGMGTVAQIHRKSIEHSEIAKLVAVCDSDFKKMEGFSLPCYTNLEEMLQKESLDCVHICLPHHLHASTIKLCSQYGVSVFSEKPIALTYEECGTLFSIDNIKIGVCLQNRYNSTVIALKKEMVSEDLGDFLGAKGIVTWCRQMPYYEESPWRGKKSEAGGGVMINQAIHTLDLLSDIGGEFVAVQGKIANFSLPNTEIEDTVMCRLTYESGASAMFFATIAYVENSTVELEFVFEKAIYQIKDGELHKISGDSRELLAIDQSFSTESGGKAYYGDSHFQAITAFHKALQENTEDFISVREASKSVKILNSIEKSSKMDKILYLCGE